MIRALLFCLVWAGVLAYAISVKRPGKLTHHFNKFAEALWDILTFKAWRKKPKPQVLLTLGDRMIPEEHMRVIRKAALQEHEFGLMPHTDPDILAACLDPVCYASRLPKPPKGDGGGSPQMGLMMQAAAKKQKHAEAIMAVLMEKDRMGRMKDGGVIVYGDNRPLYVLDEGMTVTPLPKQRPPDIDPDYDMIEEIRNRT